ncbi:MAG TPA: hypothetical protein DCL54_07580, partial [Alphaproteobacteria bacterium]|nr:hypothetical protein [Alphaproteobacteria bacterium]
MPLRVTHLTIADPDPKTGQARIYHFDDNIGIITFGRQVDRAIGFPEDDTRVSAVHFAIRRLEGSGTYVYEVATGKPVYLKGKAIYEGTQVGPQDIVNVGKPNGPSLRIEAAKAGVTNMKETDDLARDRGGAVAGAVARSERSIGMIAGVLGAMALTTFGLFYFVRTLTVEQKSLQTGLQRMAQGLTAAEKGIAETRDAVPGLTEEKYKSLAALQRQVVYQVFVRQRAGDIRATATAFAIMGRDGKPVLATNAHVAELKEVADRIGAEFVVVPSGGGTAIPIDSVRVHPGYEIAKDFAASAARLASAGLSRPMALAPSYDVALMMPKDPSRITITAQLAPQGDLDGMRAGQSLTYAGFPAENLVGTDPDKPEPTQQRGAVTAMTGFFMSSNPGEAAYLIQTSLPLAGGASGGPIFNLAGQVVGIANAVNMNFLQVSSDETLRMPSAALVNYGQRADLINHLLDGTADEAWIATLKESMAAFQGNLMKSASDDLLYREATWKETDTGKAAKLVAERSNVRMSESLSVKNGARPAAKIAFDAEPGHTYAVFAASPSQTLSLVVFDDTTAISANAAAAQVLAG